MYVKESAGTQIFGILDQAAKFDANRMGWQDKLLRETAKSDLFYAQAQMQSETQDFLRGLEQRNDYENFERDTDNFLNKQKNALAKSAPNAYTANLYNELITSQRNQLQNTVRNQALKMQVNDIQTKDQGAIQLNRNALSGQAGIQANSIILNSEFANGMRDENYTHAALIDDATKNAQKEWLLNGRSLMNDIIAKGGDFSQVEKLINNLALNSEYKVLMLSSAYASEEGLKKANPETGEGYLNIGNEIDKNAIAKGIIAQLKTEYKATVDEMQEKNMGEVTEWYGKMVQLSPTDQLYFADACLMKLETDMSGNKLNPSQRAQAVNFFKTIADGKGAKKASEDMLKKFDLKVKDLTKRFINLYLDGSIDPYGARDSFLEAVTAEFKDLTGSESKEEMLRACPSISNFLDELYKQVPDEIQGIVDGLKKKFVTMAKDAKMDGIEGLEAGFVDLVFDTLSTIKLSEPKKIEAAVNNLTTELNAWEGKRLDVIRKNPKTGKIGLEIGIGGEEAALYDYLTNLQGHDHYAYKDRNGVNKASVLANGSETFERAAGIQGNLLKKEFDITSDEDFGKRFKVQFEQDPEDAEEILSTQVFVENVGGTAKYWKYVPDKETKSLKLYSKLGNGEWTEEKRKSEVEKEKRAEERKDIAAEVRPLAEKIDLKTARALKLTGPWEKKLSVKDYKWVTDQIVNMINEYNTTKDKRKKEDLKNKLNILGYKTE